MLTVALSAMLAECLVYVVPHSYQHMTSEFCSCNDICQTFQETEDAGPGSSQCLFQQYMEGALSPATVHNGMPFILAGLVDMLSHGSMDQKVAKETLQRLDQHRMLGALSQGTNCCMCNVSLAVLAYTVSPAAHAVC